MAYTAPTTRSTGNTITAAIWNADMVDNVKWLATDKPSCRVYASSAGAVTNNTLTAVAFDSELWDNGGMHSTASNTSRITVPSGGGGIYLIGGHIAWEANATGFRGISIVVNGTVSIAGQELPVTTAATAFNQSITSLYSLGAGDYVELKVLQVSGGNLNVLQNAHNTPEFWAIWQQT